jgi:hypothetical protein
MFVYEQLFGFYISEERDIRFVFQQKTCAIMGLMVFEIIQYIIFSNQILF